MSEAEISGHLGQSDHAVKFKTSVDSRKSAKRFSTLHVRIHREAVDKVPLGNAFAGAGLHQSWPLFMHQLIRAQEKSVLKYQKSGRWGRRPAWLSRNLLELRKKIRKKESVCPVEVKSGEMGGMQRCCLLLQGGNLCGQSSIGVEAGQYSEGQ